MCMLLTALGLPDDMSRSFVLALKVQDFFESSLCFSIEGPRFYLRVAVTIILKYFVKLAISLYYKYSRKY